MQVKTQFGMSDKPTCNRCSGTMALIRHARHPIYGADYELQTFQCKDCGSSMQRSVDRDGKRK
jgi:transposase-like protein